MYSSGVATNNLIHASASTSSMSFTQIGDKTHIATPMWFTRWCAYISHE